MRFFFDNNLSPRLSKALDALEGEQGHAVIHLKQKFDKAVPDEEWLSALGDEGNWIVLTSDYRTERNPTDRRYIVPTQGAKFTEL